MKLSSSALASLPPSVSTPSYARDKLRPSIVHIGVGNFHRSHLATYIDDLCRLGSTQWAITGAGVLASDAVMAASLGAQDILFTVASRGANSTCVRVVGAMTSYIHAHPDPSELIRAIAAADTQIVSLTVTEGGYPVDDATGMFDASSTAATPSSAFATLASGLEARRAAGMGPLTVLSCDNIVGNGHVARTATLGMAERIGNELVTWIEEHISFPNSMVDRITPATTEQDKEFIRENYGIDDAWPVVAEDFRQWVVEDKFAGQRLPLELLDVIIAKDVAPYENLKLRLLNAGHCCLAYPAAILGIHFVHDAMGDADIAGLVQAFMECEAAPVLEAVPGIDVPKYIASLLHRFANPAVRDQIARLCLDGSAKLPKFLLPTVQAQLERRGPVEISAFILATWCRYLTGKTEQRSEYQVSADPLKDEIMAHAEATWSGKASFLELSIFGADISRNKRFLDAFGAVMHLLQTQGTRSAVRELVRKAKNKT